MPMQRPFALAIATILLCSTVALAQEKKVQSSDLPSAVARTVEAQSHGTTVRGISMEKENGQTFYEAEMTVNGHSKDILIDSNGEVEEEVPINSLPSQVVAGLQAKAGRGKLVKIESLTKHDKLVAHEAQVLTAGKKSEGQVGPDGKPLDHEE